MSDLNTRGVGITLVVLGVVLGASAVMGLAEPAPVAWICGMVAGLAIGRGL